MLPSYIQKCCESRTSRILAFFNALSRELSSVLKSYLNTLNWIRIHDAILEKTWFLYTDQSAVEGGERGLRAGKRLDETGGKRTGAVPATAFSNLTNSPIRKPLPAAEVRRMFVQKEKKRTVLLIRICMDPH
jgi:hypothetical protein